MTKIRSFFATFGVLLFAWVAFPFMVIWKFRDLYSFVHEKELEKSTYRVVILSMEDHDETTD